MKTTNLPLEKLIAYAGNPRRNDHAVEAVAAAIKRFGFRVPVLAHCSEEFDAREQMLPQD
jgi:ParB-like chromosome segregation protein Spo0J